MKKPKTGEPIQSVLGRILTSKQKTRLQLAKLPIHKKIEILVELQKMAKALHPTRPGRCVHVWKI